MVGFNAASASNLLPLLLPLPILLPLPLFLPLPLSIYNSCVKMSAAGRV